LSNAPRIWTRASRPLLIRLIGERLVDISLTLGSKEVAPSSQQDRTRVTRTNISTSLAARDHAFNRRPPHLPSPPRISDFALPVFPRITLPPISLPFLGINNTLEPHIAPSVPRHDNDKGATEIGSAASSDSVFVSLLSNAQNGESGNVS
jgi:hypothetical protein